MMHMSPVHTVSPVSVEFLLLEVELEDVDVDGEDAVEVPVADGFKELELSSPSSSFFS